MLRRIVHWFLPALSAVAAGWMLVGDRGLAGDEPLAGYADYDAYRREMQSIGASKLATLESLGRTLGGREIYLLEIGTGKRDDKPAVLVVGGVHAPHLLGSELAVRLARRLVDRAAADKSVGKLLDRVTFYVIPRVSPDATEACFRRPLFERTTNERPVDDDGDGAIDEDGPDDLNGDGLITMLRVEDPSGPYRLHPDDERIAIEADKKKDERGRYALYVEGRDNDRDEKLNEDPPGGVDFNRNFTFRYPYRKPGAGRHQVSEVESRAVADFAFAHPNVAVVVSFTPEDNLMHPWKPDAEAERQRIKTTLLAGDARYFNHVARRYRAIHGAKDAPKSPPGEGSFSDWAYFHYGRWSFACRGWWPVPTDPTTDRGDQRDGSEPEAGEQAKPTAKPQSDAGDRRGADERNALAWLAEKKIDGFVDWQPIEHPDFPSRKVEVGGFKPFVRLNPPEGELDALADKHGQFLEWLAGSLPRLAIGPTEAEALGHGVWRVRAVVENRGYLPTAPEMGRIAREPHPLQIAIDLPRGAKLVTGHARVQLPALAGEGGRAEHTWLAFVPPGAKSLRVRAWSPSVGRAVAAVPLAVVQTEPETR